MKKMKFIPVAAMMMAGVSLPMTAQDDTTESHWFVGVQGGVQNTLTHHNNKKTFTPTMALSLGHFFIPQVGARLNINGFWNTGTATSYLTRNNAHWDYKYMTTNADLMVNLCSTFGQKESYPLNLYLIGGFGLYHAWDADEAAKLAANAHNLHDTGAGKRNAFNGRLGLQLATDLSRNLALNLEATYNMHAGNQATFAKDDRQIVLLAGVAYKFGHKQVQPFGSHRNLTTDVLGDLEDIELTSAQSNKYASKPMTLNEMTAKGLQEIGLPTMKDGAYNSDKKLLAVKLGDNLPDIYLNVDEAALPAFADKSNIEFRNVKYQLDENNEYKLVYADVYNRATGQTYTYDNLDGKLEYNGNTTNFKPLEAAKQPEKTNAKQPETPKMMAAQAKEQTLNVGHTNVMVKTKVLPKNTTSDYEMGVTYTVEKEFSMRNDYPSGKFVLEESNAGAAMMKVIKDALEGEYAQYMQPGKRLKVKITGSADATPIRSTIPYDGAYGNFRNQPVQAQGKPATVTVNTTDGIDKNEQLAFLRAAGVKENFERNIPAIKQMKTDYEYDITVSKLKGSEYRKVSVVLTFEDAF